VPFVEAVCSLANTTYKFQAVPSRRAPPPFRESEWGATFASQNKYTTLSMYKCAYVYVLFMRPGIVAQRAVVLDSIVCVPL
jgi:hypothetical protein